MTAKEAGCYQERYKDLENAFNGNVGALQNHWIKYGDKEGRTKTCAPRISENQAKCYLFKYVDLQKAFGQTKNSWKQARKHWYTNGFAEGRQAECENKAVYCADEGGSCDCQNGRIHYGRKKVTNSQDPRASFEDMN